MRTFTHFPENSICPICGKNNDKETVLIGISGTGENGYMEGQPIHTDCLDLRFEKETGIIYHYDLLALTMFKPE